MQHTVSLCDKTDNLNSMPCCQVRHWDTDYHLPALTSILQCMQPELKWYWLPNDTEISNTVYIFHYIATQFQNCSFSEVFLSVGINWHSINYFLPFSFHYTQLSSFWKSLKVVISYLMLSILILYIHQLLYIHTSFYILTQDTELHNTLLTDF